MAYAGFFQDLSELVDQVARPGLDGHQALGLGACEIDHMLDHAVDTHNAVDDGVRRRGRQLA